MNAKKEYQIKNNNEIQELLKRISIKSKNFEKKNLDTCFGDLGWVLKELKEIDSFINDKYLKN